MYWKVYILFGRLGLQSSLCPLSPSRTRPASPPPTPPNGGPNHDMSPHLAPLRVNKMAQFSSFSQVRSVGTTVPTLTTPSAPPAINTSTHPADARQINGHTGSPPRTAVLNVGTAAKSNWQCAAALTLCRSCGSAVPDRAGNARPDTDGPWKPVEFVSSTQQGAPP